MPPEWRDRHLRARDAALRGRIGLARAALEARATCRRWRPCSAARALAAVPEFREALYFDIECDGAIRAHGGDR